MNYMVAVPLDPSLAEFIGKKGSENGITFYNRKVGNDVIVAVAPTSPEEKFYAVAEALTIAGRVVMSTASVDRLFGEMLVACSLLGKRVIFTKDSDIGNLMSSVKIKDAEFAGRDELLQKITAPRAENGNAAARVDVDKCFNVKGIGAVALGVVTRGVVRTHDELCHSSGKRVIVRSIQSQDEDVNEAGVGTRVGLALKGIEESEVDKGDLLTKEPNGKAGKVKARLEASGMGREEVAAGKSYNLVCNFSVSRATVESYADGVAMLRLEKALALMQGDEFLLLREQVPRIFAKGTIVP